MKEYNSRNIPLARKLRKNMTPWERKLWFMFLRTYPIKFQRQKAIGEYIVDFYCAKAKLVLELDGGGHYDGAAVKKDTIRDETLAKLGITVLRICNTEIDKNFYGVCTFVDMKVQKAISFDNEDAKENTGEKTEANT